MTGHVSGLPVEELLPTLLSGGGAWVLLRLTSLGSPPSLDRPRPCPLSGCYRALSGDASPVNVTFTSGASSTRRSSYPAVSR